MDTNICGLNRLTVITNAYSPNYKLIVTDDINSWEKIIDTSEKANGVVFLIPSIPAPAKKTYTIKLVYISSGANVHSPKKIELGFGDSKTVHVSNSLMDTDTKTFLTTGSLISAATHEMDGGTEYVLAHSRGYSDTTYGLTYDQNPYVGGSFDIPYIKRDAFGHVSGGGLSKVTLPAATKYGLRSSTIELKAPSGIYIPKSEDNDSYEFETVLAFRGDLINVSVSGYTTTPGGSYTSFNSEDSTSKTKLKANKEYAGAYFDGNITRITLLISNPTSSGMYIYGARIRGTYVTNY